MNEYEAIKELNKLRNEFVERLVKNQDMAIELTTAYHKQCIDVCNEIGSTLLLTFKGENGVYSCEHTNYNESKRNRIARAMESICNRHNEDDVLLINCTEI